MKNRLINSLGPLLGVVLFVVALGVLYHELRLYHFQDIVRHIRDLPGQSLFLAFLLTVLSYLIMTGYDLLALRYVRKPLPYCRTALASFIGYAFSNNMGLSMLAGGSVRFRFYSAWGLSAFEIGKVIAFCTATLWLGFLALSGIVFLSAPMVIPGALHLPFASVRPIGMIFLVLVGALFMVTFLRKAPLNFRGWAFKLPDPRLFTIQMAISSLDWAVSGGVLYSLLPSSSGISFPVFLGVFLLAQLAGLASQIPGGLGVFETVVLVLLSPAMPASAIFGSLLAYRGIYYLLPLLAAAVLMATQEVLQKKEGFQKIARLAGQIVSGVVPHILAFATFVGGAILLFSGATPAVSERLAWIKDFVPLPAMEVSHLLGSVVGAGLLLLARGLQRRIDAAYLLTAILLGAGAVFSLFKGVDYEEALVLAIVLGALLPCRRHFYRKASLISEKFTPGWTAAVVIVLLCSVWLGMFSYKHVEYSLDLWWRFTVSGDAPRFLRATFGAIGIALLFSVAKLLRPAAPRPSQPAQTDLEKATAIVQRATKTYANLALLGDKTLLFSENNRAFIMYSIEGKSWISMGNPVGPLEEWPELLWRFREMCDRYDGWTVFYEIGPNELDRYLDLGLTLLKFGEEGRVSLEKFSLEGGARKELRHTVNKLEREGCSFEIIPPEDVPPLLPDLERISNTWLAEKNTREKGFSLGFFSEDYLKRYSIALVRKKGAVVAFANLWQGAGKEELSIDLMRYAAEAPGGAMDYLFVRLMLWGKQEGYRWFSMGMAPFAGLEDHPLAPLWNRLGAFLFRHGEHFYNFQGLREYKDKFDPQWESKYLAAPGGFVLPRVLANLAALVSGGMKGVVAK